MPFPPLKEKVVYENNPLAEVTARLVFSPLLTIANDSGAAFQEHIRDLYPYYVPDQREGIRDFLSEDVQWKASISPSSVELSTTVYTRWHEFRRRLQALTEIFVDTYGNPRLFAAQLLYRDVINRTQLGCPDKPWTELLSTPLHGELAVDGIGNQIDQLHRRFEIELESCPGRLKLTQTFDYTDNGEQVFVLDSLFSYTFNGDLDDGYRYLEQFHDVAGPVFRWAITDELHERLVPRAPEDA